MFWIDSFISLSLTVCTLWYGPFAVLKRIGSSIYRLDRPIGIKVHLVFHVTRLKELLGSDDSSFSIKTLVTLEDLSSKPHEPERILDSPELYKFSQYHLEALET